MEPALIASVGLVVSLISGLVSDNVLPRIVAALSRRQAQKRTQEQFGDFNVRVETSGVWWRNEPVVRVETREAARGPRAGLRLSDADRGELTRQFREALRQELRKEGRRTFWLGFLQGAFFFALGVGATLLIS